MNVKLYDSKDWSERETESYREVVVETPVERLTIREIAGSLHVIPEPSPLRG